MLLSRFGRSLAALGIGLFVAHASAAPMSIAEALADPGRPAEQRAVDGVRKPAEILALTSAKAGDRVADVGPGGGYYTRLFSRIVGESEVPCFLVDLYDVSGEGGSSPLHNK
jgi:predicted methyltransferase